jgi:hypothetical protein
MFYYTYYSYEEWGRGYIGAKPSGCECLPQEDPYLGSFYDKTFKPTHKIVLGVYASPEECLEAEIKLHRFFDVDINPHFANQAKQTSTGFIARGGKPRPSISGDNNPMRKYPGLLSGDKNGMFGKTHTPEAKRRLREAIKGTRRRAKPIVLIHPDGTEERFEAAIDACKKYDLQKSKLCAVLKGTRHHHKNFRGRWQNQ